MTTVTVEVRRKDPEADPAGARLLRAAKAAGHALERVRIAACYELGGELDRRTADRLAGELLSDPVLDVAQVTWPGEETPSAARGEVAVTALRRPGVMDPVALTTQGAAKALGAAVTRVRTARRVYATGPRGARPTDDALAWLQRRLGNAIVDQVVVGGATLPDVPHGSSAPGALREEVPLLALDDAALVQLSKTRTLALDLAEMRAVKAHFGSRRREPTVLELETIAQTWSEHCKHKTLTGVIDHEERDVDGRVLGTERIENLLKSTIFAATKTLDLPRCLSVFEDNAGVIRFDERLGVAIKVETHNHPSAIEPYGGAGTGVGGVIRDILGTGLGADPILNLDVFCVGDLDAKPADVPRGSIHPKTVLEGVVSGVRDYGNRMGIPTICGALVTEPRYAGNPLVFAGTVGLIPIERVHKAARPGDQVVVVGGRTGRDGIHGATFSSLTLDSSSEVESGGAVQIGNPIAQKMLADVLLDLRDRGWLTALTDCGAGGLSSAVGEMAAETGARVDLALAPLKYPGLGPWEVWVSEAQERMVLAVAPEHLPGVLAAFAAEDVEAVRLGEFTGDRRLVLEWSGEVVGELDVEFLHRGLPRQVRPSRWTRPRPRPIRWPAIAPGALLKRVLATPTVCSKEWIVRQYDHEVQGASAVKPFVGARSRGPSDGVAVVPLLTGHDRPDALSSRRAVVVGLGINPRHGEGDPRLMAHSVIDEALRNLVATGGDPDAAAILDNFSWGDCRRPETLGAMVRAARGCQDAALAYRAPFISGKDSLNNEYEVAPGQRVAIPGTLLVTALAVADDAAQLMTMDLKAPGDLLVLVGPSRAALLGALAVEVAGAPPGGASPEVDLELGPKILRAVHQAIRRGAVRACHDLSEGGLAVAAAEMAFAGDVGASLDLDRVPRAAGDELLAAGHVQADGAAETTRALELTLLFGESPSRFLLEVAPTKRVDVEAALAGVPFAVVGKTEDTGALRVTSGGKLVLDEPLAALESAWRDPLFSLYA